MFSKSDKMFKKQHLIKFSYRNQLTVFEVYVIIIKKTDMLLEPILSKSLVLQVNFPFSCF